MAIDVCSEISSPGISPRISFSYDLNQSDACYDRLDSTLLESNPDFDFCIGGFLELSSADELFSNGKIRPVEIKKNPKPTIKTHRPTDSAPIVTPRASTSPSAISEKKSLKELLSTDFDSEKKPQSKSFWQFRRSSSLNCESSRSGSLIRPLQFLSRSNSTGSAGNSKPAAITKETQKPHLQRQPSVSGRKSPASCPGTSYGSSIGSSQKPAIKKSHGGHGNGVRIISPLLNLPAPNISKATVGFFGFGSLFCRTKVRKKK